MAHLDVNLQLIHFWEGLCTIATAMEGLGSLAIRGHLLDPTCGRSTFSRGPGVH